MNQIIILLIEHIFRSIFTLRLKFITQNYQTPNDKPVMLSRFSFHW